MGAPGFPVAPVDPLTGVEAARFGVYVHFPYCLSKCPYCDFASTAAREVPEERYARAVLRELEMRLEARPELRGRRAQSLYFGGGTPSYISVRQLEGLVSRLQAALPWTGAEEVTFECEPGTLTRSKLAAIRAMGVTRLSLGIENFDDDILRENGRAHISTEIYRVLPFIAEMGFDQLNVDLIAGMVGETWETWRETVRKTLEIEPDSVTIYQMELPYNTVYSQSLMGGAFDRPLADWATKRDWHGYAFAELAAAGYVLSSAYTMVKPKGASSRFVYRDSVWHGSDMLGAGVASFSHLSGVHFQNVAGWSEYLAALAEKRLPLGRGLTVTDRERLTREMILQLKLGTLTLPYFRSKFGVDVLTEFAPAWAELEEQGMLRLGDDTVELNPAGLMQVDRLLPSFYDERYRNARYT